MRRAFTMVELMVAVSLLVVVIAATSRIFSTASRVAGLGEANTNILQETAAIERQIRGDLARLDTDGVFVIQCVAVGNNVNQTANPSAPLIDPSRPPNAIIRADQLLFFAKGSQDSARFSGGQVMPATSGLARSAVSRVLYGHGVQLPDLIPVGGQRPDPIGFDDGPLVPWSFDSLSDGASLDYQYWIGGGGGRTNGTQPEARDWTLARQAVLLADDGNIKTLFQSNATYGPNSAVSLFNQANLYTPLSDAALSPNPDVVNARVDVAASNLDDIRRILAPAGNANWRTRIINGFFGAFGDYGQLGGYVRSEKRAPSMDRQDVMLTTSTLASNCSTFMVDWTWARGVGSTVVPTAPVQTMLLGFTPSGLFPTPWFGFPDQLVANVDEQRGVTTLIDYQRDYVSGGNSLFVQAPIVPAAIEGSFGSGVTPVARPFGAGVPISVYTAVFGFNGDKAYFQSFATSGSQFAPFVTRSDFTPWPTAIRITMTLNDPQKKLEQGKTVQLVIELPQRPVS